MKILLVSPAYQGASRFYFPGGVAMISSVLKAAGHDVHCRNLDLVEDWEQTFTDDFRRITPQVVASGGMTPSFGFFKRLFALAKELDPDTKTVLGGGILGSEPLVLSAMQADIGVIGEGEITAVELMDNLKAGRDILEVPGLLVKTASGETVQTPARPYITDLDAVPLADYHGFGFGECLNRNPFQSITTSRGCPFHCTFCYCVMGRGKYRFNSIDHVIGEIEYLRREFDLCSIGLIDEIFALKRERIQEFCDKVKPLGISWCTQVRVEVVDEDLLRTMREAGCTLLFYGLESMSPAVLGSMNKRLKPAQVAQALELTYRCGLRVFGNFIFGDPIETADTAWETLEWWLANRKHAINLGKIDCWPGTAIYKRALESGAIADPIEYIEKGCPLTNLTSMPRPDWVAMMRRVWTCHEAMIFPCRLLSVHPDQEGGAAECICPHCGRIVRLTGLNATPVHPDRGTQRVTCPTCPFDFDMPLRIPPQKFGSETLNLFETAWDIFVRTSSDCAPANPFAHVSEAALAEIVEHLKPFWDMGWEHPLAAYLAALAYQLQGDHLNANEVSRRGLRHNPTAPYLLEMCAASYRRLGDLNMCLAFQRQALLVRQAREQALSPEAQETLDPFEARFRRMFASNAVNLDSGVFWG